METEIWEKSLAATVREGEDFGGSKSLRRRRSLILGVKSDDHRGGDEKRRRNRTLDLLDSDLGSAKVLDHRTAISAATKEKKNFLRESPVSVQVEKLQENKEESGEHEAIFRRFTASAVPTLERIPALCSGARISERGLGFGKEEDEPEAHGLVWHQIKLVGCLFRLPLVLFPCTSLLASRGWSSAAGWGSAASSCLLFGGPPQVGWAWRALLGWAWFALWNALSCSSMEAFAIVSSCHIHGFKGGGVLLAGGVLFDARLRQVWV
ncbi:hypothetical protein U1Q18_028831 [Sarracenia purpurea var. burkii]